VGFVVSQDGDLRVMTQVKGNVVLWENIRLRLDDEPLASNNRQSSPKAK
jgi:hypothetical protein